MWREKRGRKENHGDLRMLANGPQRDRIYHGDDILWVRSGDYDPTIVQSPFLSLPEETRQSDPMRGRRWKRASKAYSR